MSKLHMLGLEILLSIPEVEFLRVLDDGDHPKSKSNLQK